MSMQGPVSQESNPSGARSDISSDQARALRTQVEWHHVPEGLAKFIFFNSIHFELVVKTSKTK